MNRCVNRSLLSPAPCCSPVATPNQVLRSDREMAPSPTARTHVLRTVAGDPVLAVLVDDEYVTIVTLAEMGWLAAGSM